MDTLGSNTLVNDINKTIDDLVEVILNTDDKHLDAAVTENSWSVGQVVEHIIICGSGIPDTKTEAASRPPDEKVPILKDIFLNMNEKYKADPSLSPRSNRHDKNELSMQVDRMRANLIQIVKEKDLSLLCLDMEFPSIGFLTRYEWIRFILFHTQRHTIQARNTVEEIMRNSGVTE